MESADKLRILETLVDELIKEAPEEKVVQSCMTAMGLADGRDPIDRINKVLAALEFELDDDDKKEMNQ